MGIPLFTDDFPINISISREFPSQSRWMTPEGYLGFPECSPLKEGDAPFQAVLESQQQ